MIIGDGACGKTSLLSVFTLGYFPTVSLTRINCANDLADSSLFSITYVAVDNPRLNSHTDPYSRFRLFSKTMSQIAVSMESRCSWRCGIQRARRTTNVYDPLHTRKHMSSSSASQ